MRDAEVPIFLEMSICDVVSKLAVCSKPDLLAPRRRGALCIVVPRIGSRVMMWRGKSVEKGNDERNVKKCLLAREVKDET